MDFVQRVTGLFEKLENRLSSSEEKTFRRIVLLFYIFFVTLNILTHEMWFDEMQAWLIAKDSNSLADLVHNLRYDGHPLLWYIPLHLLSRITHNPAAMQFFHLIIASCVAYVFLRFAPFSKPQKFLFIFGYFPVYEYAAISRNYALGILFIFLFCALFRPGPNKNYLSLSIVLFLLMQTNIHGLLIAVSLVCMLIFEFLITPELKIFLAAHKWQVVSGGCLVIVGLVFAGILVTPESDGSYANMWLDKLNLNHFPNTLSTFWKGFVPIPRLNKYCYWDTNIFPGRTLPAFLSLFIIFFVLLMFIRNRLILFLFSFGTALMLVFKYLIYYGYIRHHGHFFILFVACLWLERYYHSNKEPGVPLFRELLQFSAKHKNSFLNILLVTHLAVGLFASGMDWFRPFSRCKNVAQYIKENRLDRLPILGDSDAWAATISGYIDQQFYYPTGDRFGTFLIFDKKRSKPVSESMIVEKANQLAINGKTNVLLFLSYRLQTPPASFTKIKEFHAKTIWVKEDFYLYLLKYTE